MRPWIGCKAALGASLCVFNRRVFAPTLHAGSDLSGRPRPSVGTGEAIHGHPVGPYRLVIATEGVVDLHTHEVHGPSEESLGRSEQLLTGMQGTRQP